ncbi:MAG TPA: hypothetical protein VFB79_11810 [Candidatus Angelobacter sp.]|nr:hypothetical protein [Candidatus Angelobacter sp.]
MRQEALRTTTCVGTILLELQNALAKAEKCRQALAESGYSRQRWQEIINDVEPELRFVVRPKVLDSIVILLRSVGKPVVRDALIQQLVTQGVGPVQRIRQSITAHLHSGKLVAASGDKIGLAEWDHRR